MTDQPKDTPKCCGQDAKWVEQTPSLAYFFCSTCKTEPKYVKETPATESFWDDNKAGYTEVGGLHIASLKDLYSNGQSWGPTGRQIPLSPITDPWGTTSHYLKPTRIYSSVDFCVGMRVEGLGSGALATVICVNTQTNQIRVRYDGSTDSIAYQAAGLFRPLP